MKAFADLLFPDSCLGCGRIVKGGLCTECLESQKRVGWSITSGVFDFDESVQTYAFSGLIRQAIHRLKYKGERSLGEVLALPLIAELKPQDLDVVTWVPAPHQKVVERGFDHAQLLAEAAAAQTGMRCIGLLERTRDAVPQMGLDLEQRKNNVVGVFASRIPSPDRVVLIDDVYTTGATASDAARALKERGAERVLALAIARTP
ncbi:MAG: ComF family protein [Acidimicrobiia bacterium]